MSLQTPTIQAINDNLTAQLEGTLGQTLPLLPKSFTRVLAKALAAVFVLLYKYAGWIFLQLFVSSASFDETTVNGQTIRPLVEWGRLIGVGDPDDATRAELRVAVAVDQQIGDIQAGTKLFRVDTEVVYSVVSAVALDADSVTITVQAVDDSQDNLGFGTLGNLSVGDELEFANPLPYVQRIAVVSAVVTTAVDEETEEAYRQRVVDRFQAKPQGGAYADYRAWATEVEGVVGAYPFTGDPGEVDVFIETTNAPDGLATADQIDGVAASIEFDVDGLASRRPATALVNVRSITRLAVDVEISGLVISTGMLELRGDIESAVDEHLRARRRFQVGLDVLPDRSDVSSAAVGGVVARVVSAAGGSFSGVRVLVSGGAISRYLLEPGQLAKLGTTTYL